MAKTNIETTNVQLCSHDVVDVRRDAAGRGCSVVLSASVSSLALGYRHDEVVARLAFGLWQTVELVLPRDDFAHLPLGRQVRIDVSFL